ncbi:MAG: 50S ribosomal protein L9 [Hyphomicrobiales bacterium]|nr:MAG: 50S ribosomal protein L9 [Hyphomicrobiales bacterium]PCH81734.1 MAG: 50S ribosomal protein L9 [Hyphomicrobiales bacterium]
MQVILLERVAKLGQMGETVRVRDGYGRNFLLPSGKALRATKENLKRFEAERAQLETRNLEMKSEAESASEKIDGVKLIVIRQASETGQLYGSVTPRDISTALTENGYSVDRKQVVLTNAIKVIGLHEVSIVLHPEVSATVTLNVARSEDEATRQETGEDLTKFDRDDVWEPEEEEPEEDAEKETSEEDTQASEEISQDSEE